MKSWLAKAMMVTFSVLAMAFVFLNTYEMVFNEDVAIANSIRPLGIQTHISEVVEQFNIKPEASYGVSHAEYKKLEYLQIPALAANLYLEEKRFVNGRWYARPSMAHVIGLNKDERGTTIDYLIYTTSSWQTLPSPNQLEEGMDVKLFHDGQTLSQYRVAEKRVLPLAATYVPTKSEDRQIVLLVEQPAKGVYYGFSLTPRD